MITGIQESLSREEITSLVERYGGKVTSAVSGRTAYLITGEEAGKSKTEKVSKYILVIDLALIKASYGGLSFSPIVRAEKSSRISPS